MPKIEQKKLLFMTGVTEVAWSFIGIFFLFFVKENFGLTVWQTIAWFGILQILFGLAVYPINHWLEPRIGLKQMIGIGVILESGFVTVLALGLSGLPGFLALNVLFLGYLSLFWPTYNYLNTLATKGSGRGKFLANIQAIYIGAGLAMPILTGWLFDMGQQQLSLWVALGFYGISIFISQQLIVPSQVAVLSFKESGQRFKKIFFSEGRFWGFLPDVTSGAAMWTLWPFYFQFIVGKFVIMGALTSLAALVEIFVTRLAGRMADRRSTKKMLIVGGWIRVMDLSLRSSFLIFSATWFVATVQTLGAILGPFFLIPYSQRTMEIGEEQSDPVHLFDYFVIREVFIGIGRGIFMLLSAFLIYYFGVWAAGIIIALAGLTALGARKL